MAEADNEQIKTMREFMLNYNKLSEVCFSDCVWDFTTRKISGMENQCSLYCAEKYLKMNQRVSTRFQMNVSISSNWSQTTGSLSLTKVNHIDDVDPEDLSAESCVLLTPTTEDERGELIITGSVSAIILITDAPRWEVLGNLGYLFSVHGELLEDVDDSKIYSVKIVLKSRSYEKVTLRLPPSCKSCWIYKASAMASSEPNIPPPSVGHFDIENINSLLPTSSQSKLSDGATKFKSLFDSFQSGGGGGGAVQPQLDPRMMMMMKMNINQQDNKPGQTQRTAAENLMLKSYIDSKFEELEKKVITLIEDKDKINQAKLDKIINLLESKTDVS